jgi:hypothetical protein
LRLWPEHVDKFIRIRFTDEDSKIMVRDSHLSVSTTFFPRHSFICTSRTAVGTAPWSTG